jgi:hypothetical protein
MFKFEYTLIPGFLSTPAPSPTKPPSKLKLSTSIKLNFKEVKDGALSRSRSLSASVPKTSAHIRNRILGAQ